MSGTTANPYRFGGQVGYRRDGPSRQHVRARHLDTNKGRWISEDPLGVEGGNENLYRYVGNEPVGAVDPSGLLPADIQGCVRGSREGCFVCMYQRYTNLTDKRHYNLRYSPKKACDLANHYCRTRFECTPCGPTGFVHQRHVPGCLDLNQAPDYANWLHDRCGALNAAPPSTPHSGDKMAHCWGCCMANMCGGFIGDFAKCSPIFKNGRGRDPVEDDMAAQMGRDCHCEQGSYTTVTIGEYCLQCCAKKTYNLHFE